MSKDYNRPYRMRVRYEVLTHYSKGTPACACCGETLLEFLCIDHIDGGGGAQRKMIGGGGVKFYQWLKKKNFPKSLKLRVLCHNCNSAYGMWGYCPHSSSERLVVSKTLSQQKQEAVLAAAIELHTKGKYPTCKSVGAMAGVHYQVVGKYRKTFVRQRVWPCCIKNCTVYGDIHHNAVLSSEKVKTIIELFDKKISNNDIADQFGVSRSTINDIQGNRTWKHIPRR